jgi:hypothetical protein
MIYIIGIQPFMELSGIDLVTDSRKERIHAYIQTAVKARCLAAGPLLQIYYWLNREG